MLLSSDKPNKELHMVNQIIKSPLLLVKIIYTNSDILEYHQTLSSGRKTEDNCLTYIEIQYVFRLDEPH